MEKPASTGTALEQLMAAGIMDERDRDFLYHLYIPATEEVALEQYYGQPLEVALEGVIGATIKDQFGQLISPYSEIKGWFLGVESKRKYVEDVCNDLIDWLKDKQADYRDLDLDMGSFKTWMKTSETFFWRYYFLLEDNVYREAMNDIKKGDVTSIETIVDINWKDRTRVARMLDSVRDIRGLIMIVETYRDRSNSYFQAILKRKVKVKMAPFQVILLGATDLRLTVKKIVNLAI